MKYSFLLILTVTGFVMKLNAQDYSAVHGSNYSGSLSVYNNPASIVNSPYKWDLTLFGMQYQSITNAVKGPNFPLILSPSSTFFAANGNYPRIGDINLNIHLLNGRISLDKNHAFAFGVNIKSYSFVTTGDINYTDSVKGPRSFLALNESNGTISADLESSSWMEVYGSYGATIRDNTVSRLNVGASLKILRSMAGAFAKVKGVLVQREDRPNEDVLYKIADGEAKYGYSNNLGDGESFSAGDLFSGSKTGFAIDLGVEYLVKSQEVSSVYDEGSENDYEWKIGLSLLDLGWNNYAYSNQSRTVSNLNDEISSFTLTEKFAPVKNMGSFNDSLATIVENYDSLSGKFKINNPARAVINVDRYLSGNFYVNGELSVNLVSSKGSKIAVNSSKLITVTPRWEKRKLGVYLPVQYNRHGNFWIGAAVKAGPLLLGTHNLLNAFSKNKYIAGGAYIAIILHPANFIKDSRNRQYECPEY